MLYDPMDGEGRTKSGTRVEGTNIGHLDNNFTSTTAVEPNSLHARRIFQLQSGEFDSTYKKARCETPVLREYLYQPPVGETQVLQEHYYQTPISASQTNVTDRT